MLFLIIVFGLIGLAVGGPIGLLVGGGLGWWLGRRISRRLNAARVQIQEGFLESIFSVMGCLCQADGKVTEGKALQSNAPAGRAPRQSSRRL